MYHYIYQVYLTNPESSMLGKIYFGKHSTNNLLDGYVGSGKLLKRYIKKYPNDYYRKILHLYNSKEELNKAEKLLISKHIGKPYCINIASGGNGGNTIAGYTESELNDFREKCSRTQKGKKHTINWDAVKRQGETLHKKYESGELICYWKGKNIPEEAKQKASETRKRKLATGEITVWNKGLTGVQEAWNKGKPVEEWMSEEGRKHLSDFGKTRTGSKNPFFGHTHSEEFSKKHSEQMKGRHRIYENDEHTKWHMSKKSI